MHIYGYNKHGESQNMSDIRLLPNANEQSPQATHNEQAFLLLLKWIYYSTAVTNSGNCRIHKITDIFWNYISHFLRKVPHQKKDRWELRSERLH